MSRLYLSATVDRLSNATSDCGVLIFFDRSAKYNVEFSGKRSEFAAFDWRKIRL